MKKKLWMVPPVKNRAVTIGLMVFAFAGLLASCATAGPYKPSSAGEEIVGTVQATFEASYGNYNIGHVIDEAAYIALVSAAKKEYQGNIDVRDITWALGKKAKGVYMYEFSSNGKVVLLNRSNSARIGSGVEGALARAAEQTLKNIPPRSRIAIVYITAQGRSTTEYIAGELEYIWVNEGYILTDRSQLDKIRREQNFQMSGEVDDKTAVSIGKLLGANIIITGRVDGDGNLRRLRLRALDTQTAQVIGVASERL